MINTIRVLALLPVVVFAAACSDSPATGPSQLPSQMTLDQPYEAVSDDVTAMAKPTCRKIVGVELAITPHQHPNRDVNLVATYIYKKPPKEACMVAPKWGASRRGLTVDPANPFRAFIGKREGTTVVMATAPNGVSGRIIF